ncbi:MAG: DUF805 domain-containing protein [Urechidicola sp.]|nr:DUF805 domain-containing protein [Urechidicola sp.]
MNWYLKVLKQYTDFSGRARRKEYWMYTLFNIIFFICAAIIDNLLGTNFEFDSISIGYGYVYMLYALFVFIPGLAVSVRRLHDVGKSGWFLLIAFIPLIGAIWLLVLYVTDGDAGNNKWGSNPKTGDDEIDMLGKA